MSKRDVEKPNKQNIQRLLREWSGWGFYKKLCPAYVEQERLSKEHDELERKLLDVEPMRKLKRLHDQARDKAETEAEAIRKRVDKIRREFYSKGLTPAVLKMINDFVEDLNQC